MPKEKDKKVIGLMKDELGGRIITEFVGLRTKTYSYLITTATKKNQKAQKSVIKRKLKFENCKNCLEATEIQNKINYLEKKNEINLDSQFIRNNNSILKTQQIF